MKDKIALRKKSTSIAKVFVIFAITGVLLILGATIGLTHSNRTAGLEQASTHAVNAQSTPVIKTAKNSELPPVRSFVSQNHLFDMPYISAGHCESDLCLLDSSEQLMYFVPYETFYNPEENIEKPVVSVPVLQEPIVAARCHFKSWMDWRSITYRNSRQWRMQQIAYTCDDGFRRVEGLYMIALGTYFLYGGVGDVFDITLSSGVTFRGVVGDIKCDRHTDPTNRFHLVDGSVVEFIVDREVMCRSILSRGDIAFAGFHGDIVSVERIPELFVVV